VLQKLQQPSRSTLGLTVLEAKPEYPSSADKLVRHCDPARCDEVAGSVPKACQANVRDKVCFRSLAPIGQVENHEEIA
jgi:hypothetical protein